MFNLLPGASAPNNLRRGKIRPAAPPNATDFKNWRRLMIGRGFAEDGCSDFMPEVWPGRNGASRLADYVWGSLRQSNFSRSNCFAASQSNTCSLPSARRCSVSINSLACQAGDSNSSSRLVMPKPIASDENKQARGVYMPFCRFASYSSGVISPIIPPCGSRRTAMRPTVGILVGSSNTLPRSLAVFLAVASTSSTTT